MNTNEIIDAIDQEISRLREAKRLLGEIGEIPRRSGTFREGAPSIRKAGRGWQHRKHAAGRKKG
jgi:hypothetical protein